MIVLQTLLIIVLVMLPGLLLVGIMKRNSDLTTLLYAVGFGLLFDLVVGLIANFTFGMNFVVVLAFYCVGLGILFLLYWKFGKPFVFEWDWRTLIVPLALYLVAVGLQFQTTLMSPNLVGSDIHLEYYYSQWTINDGYWNPNLALTTMTSALGITLLMPEYYFLTGMDLVWMFKIIPPLMLAVMPLVLFQIFRAQFGAVIAVLSVVFFITMPMYTMDLAQLVRQGQAELFFILVIAVILDDNLATSQKIFLGGLLGIGSIVMHYGMAIAFIGYAVVGSIMVWVIAWFWRKKDLVDLHRPVIVRFALLGIAVIVLFSYVVYYSSVNGKLSMWVASIPKTVVERTVVEAQAGISDQPLDSITESKDLSKPNQETPPKSTADVPSFLHKFPFLNPFWREPLVQTAIGLDFGRASLFGKIWRIFQYLIELCLVVGFLALLFRPNRNVKLQYMALVLTSFFIIVGIYVLSTYSYGMGVARVWQITLLFMSPCFVLGAVVIGKWLTSLLHLRIVLNSLIVGSTLVIFVPYFFFNSGIVFELARMKPAGFIDVPYSIGLSGQRVDIAALFDKEDVQAVEWLKSHMVNGDVVYSDANGVKLLIQRMGITMDMDLGTSMAGHIRLLERMKDDEHGYIFLRKWNVENQTLTFNGEYGCREVHKIDTLWMIDRKLTLGQVKFDNGAKLVIVE